MLKKHMAACLVATAAAMPAFAQSGAPATDRPTATGTHSTTSGSPAMLPGGTSPAPGSSVTPGTGPAASSAPASSAPGTAASATAGASASDTGGSSPSRAATAPASGAPGQHPPQGQFVAQQQQGQWLASKLIGTRVVGANNETIGDVNDVLLDRSGTAQAIVIGVGGFLGIGEKDVAVPFNALEFASAREMATTASTSPGGSGGASSTGGATSTGAGASSNAARNGDGERIVLRLTKADLQAAPTFHSNRASSTTSGAGNAGNGRPGAASGGSAPSRP